MHDSGKILAGLVVFGALVTFPVWYHAAWGGPLVKPRLPADLTEKECIAPTAYMREHHMELLNSWRAQVVRDGHRSWTGENGRQWRASLTKTCLHCHANKADFCDTCHSSAGVKPVCFDCHVDPKGRN